MWLLLTIFILIAVDKSVAVTGWDGISATSRSTFSCLKNNGYSFFIGRVGRSNGASDSTGIQNIKNARAAGIRYVDGYLFPCFSCGNGAGQVRNALSAVRNAGTRIGQLWLDVEVYHWSSNKASNQAFIMDMVNEAKRQNAHPGIYTSYYNWQQIVGTSWNYCSDLPLWYAHYDGRTTFSDFKSFGGWTAPNMKQYKGDTSCGCGVSCDKNWYP